MEPFQINRRATHSNRVARNKRRRRLLSLRRGGPFCSQLDGLVCLLNESLDGEGNLCQQVAANLRRRANRRNWRRRRRRARIDRSARGGSQLFARAIGVVHLSAVAEHLLLRRARAANLLAERRHLPRRQ